MVEPYSSGHHDARSRAVTGRRERYFILVRSAPTSPCMTVFGPSPQGLLTPSSRENDRELAPA